MTESLRRTVMDIFKVAAFVTVLAAGINLLPSDVATELVKENGPVEILTAAGLLAAAGWLMWAWSCGRIKQGCSAGVIVLLLGLRELDFHARFTTMGIFKSRFYISPTVPLTEKLVVSCIVILILVFAIWFIRRNISEFRRGVLSREPVSILILMAIITAVLSKVLDGSSEVIEMLLFMEPGKRGVGFRVIEECMELAIPICILLAISYSLRGKNKNIRRL